MTLKTTRTYELLIEFFIILLIIYLPLPLGSNLPWAWQILELVVFSLGVIWALKILTTREIVYRKTWLNLLILTALSLIIIQMIPLPVGLLKWLSPQTAQLYQLIPAEDALAQTFQPITLAPAGTREAFILLSAYGLLFLVIFNNITRQAQIKRLALVMLLVGTFEAFYGLIGWLTGEAFILGWQKRAGAGQCSGTFYGGNLFAGFLVMNIPLALGLLMALGSKAQENILASPLPNGARVRVRGITSNLKTRLVPALREPIFWQRIIIGFFGVIMITALCFSNSRGGILSCLMILICCAILLSLKKPWRRYLWYLGILVVLLLGGLYWLGFEPLLTELDSVKLGTGFFANRVPIWQSAFGIFKGFPFLGTGLGSFQEVYPQYQSLVYASYQIIHAHCDYLEILTDCGVLGWLLFCGGLLYILVFLLKVIFVSGDHFGQRLALGGLLGIAGLALQNCADFNFQIPGNAAWWIALVALALSAGWFRLRGSASKKDAWRKISLLSPSRLIVFMILSLACTFFLFRGVVGALLAHSYARYPIQVHKELQIERTAKHNLNSAITQIAQAIRYNPAEPEYYYTQGSLLRSKLEIESGITRTPASLQDSHRASEIDKILNNYRVAIRLSPLNAQYHLDLGWFWAKRHLYERKDLNSANLEKADHEFRLSFYLNPNSPWVNYNASHYWLWRLSLKTVSLNQDDREKMLVQVHEHLRRLYRTGRMTPRGIIQLVWEKTNDLIILKEVIRNLDPDSSTQFKDAFDKFMKEVLK